MLAPTWPARQQAGCLGQAASAGRYRLGSSGAGGARSPGRAISPRPCRLRERAAGCSGGAAQAARRCCRGCASGMPDAHPSAACQTAAPFAQGRPPHRPHAQPCSRVGDGIRWAPDEAPGLQMCTHARCRWPARSGMMQGWWRPCAGAECRAVPPPPRGMQRPLAPACVGTGCSPKGMPLQAEPRAGCSQARQAALPACALPTPAPQAQLRHAPPAMAACSAAYSLRCEVGVGGGKRHAQVGDLAVQASRPPSKFSLPAPPRRPMQLQLVGHALPARRRVKHARRPPSPPRPGPARLSMRTQPTPSHSRSIGSISAASPCRPCKQGGQAERGADMVHTRDHRARRAGVQSASGAGRTAGRRRKQIAARGAGTEQVPWKQAG